jgi:membrane protein YqaA with SNARE-associated domain
MFGDVSALASMAATAFLAATVLPLASETVIIGLAVADAAPLWALFVTASVANVAGCCTNWLLGRFAWRFRGRKWFPVKESSLERAANWYRRYGWPSLFLSWVPVIGDPLTMMAGVLRTPFWLFLTIVGIAKPVRYALVLWLAGAVLG